MVWTVIFKHTIEAAGSPSLAAVPAAVASGAARPVR
jgi:hypothetical protein